MPHVILYRVFSYNRGISGAIAYTGYSPHHVSQLAPSGIAHIISAIISPRSPRDLTHSTLAIASHLSQVMPAAATQLAHQAYSTRHFSLLTLVIAHVISAAHFDYYERREVLS